VIGLVTSTLYPAATPTLCGPRSAFAPAERVAQTKQTLASLRAAGIDDILLADNSDTRHGPSIRREFADVEVMHRPDFPFANRGIGEALLMLAALDRLPDDRGIVKLSGRYRLNGAFGVPDWASFAGVFRGYGFGGRRGTVSTRCYIAHDRAVLRRWLLATLAEMYAYPMRVVGPRSLLRALRDGFGGTAPSSPDEPTTSIEFALARVLRTTRAPIKLVAPIGVEGELAGVGEPTAIAE
jgi:hypothetical protein